VRAPHRPPGRSGFPSLTVLPHTFSGARKLLSSGRRRVNAINERGLVSARPVFSDRGPAPCRVTNVGEEMRVKEIWDRIEADYIEESQYQIPNPELGPLERRVGLTYEDALFSEDISVKDTEYWFSEPEGAH